MRHKAFARAALYHPQGKQISRGKGRRRTALLFDGHNSSFLKSSLILWGPWHSVIERNCVFYACLDKADLWCDLAQAIFQHCSGALRPLSTAQLESGLCPGWQPTDWAPGHGVAVTGLGRCLWRGKVSNYETQKSQIKTLDKHTQEVNHNHLMILQAFHFDDMRTRHQVSQ